MKKLAAPTLALAICALASVADAHNIHHPMADINAARHAQGMSWHGAYYNTARGVPVALVVPPTAHMQTNWGWGVSQDTVTPIYHQFRRPYYGDMEHGGGLFRPTPRWPSHTRQFGVYYIRGPY